MNKQIYLDHAATTPLLPEVAEYMNSLSNIFGNPSAIYQLGREAKDIVNKAREYVAELINAKPSEIYFTSGGTEADNWALKSSFDLGSNIGNHIITSKIEHHAILHTCEYLEKYRGANITYINVDEDGFVDLKELEDSITDQTILISVMAANNEIGTIQHIEDIARIAHKYGVYFHTDAVQAFGHIQLDVKKMGIDLLSSSAHKLGGPKGVGCLYIKDGINLPPLINGGSQENKMRAGTENVIGIGGFGKAAWLASQRMYENYPTVKNMSDYLLEKIWREIPDCWWVGSLKNRLPNNISVTFDGVRSEQLLVMLDMDGIYVSAGSACTSRSGEASHVLKAVGLSDEEAASTIRITLGAENTKEELDYVVDMLKRDVEILRNT